MKTERTLWTNAKIVTLDEKQPSAEALVTEGEWLVFVGTAAEAKKLVAPEDRTVDLAGAVVIPGFNDNHIHALFHGATMDMPDLSGLNPEQIVEKLKAHAQIIPGKSALLGRNWDEPACTAPHRALLDAAFPDRPVILTQFGGHGIWVNSVVLKQMKISRTQGPKEGIVVRDASGEPTGVLLEMGTNSPTQRHFTRLLAIPARRASALEASLKAYSRVGITSIQDNTWFHPVARTLIKMRDQGRLNVRITAWNYSNVPEFLQWLFDRQRFDDLWVRRGPLKHFLDGTFTTRTAWLTEAYRDQPGEFGMGFRRSWLKTKLISLVKKRRQGAFHSIGDRSTKEFLDVWEKVVKDFPGARNLRMRLEHGQMIRPEDVARLVNLGVQICAQPPALINPEKDNSLIGHERALKAYPYRSLLDAGVPLSFGSDMPGEAYFEPLRGIQAVTTREGPERITALEALRAYTQASAWAEFQEARKGTLAKGSLADFVVLSDDPTAVAPNTISAIQVLRTVVGGRTVYSRTNE